MRAISKDTLEWRENDEAAGKLAGKGSGSLAGLLLRFRNYGDSAFMFSALSP